MVKDSNYQGVVYNIRLTTLTESCEIKFIVKDSNC